MGPTPSTSRAFSIRGRRRSPAPYIDGRSNSKFITERGPNDPRPQDRLRDDELVGVREHAGVRVAEILNVDMGIPRVFRHTAGRVVGRVRRVLEPQPAGT